VYNTTTNTNDTYLGGAWVNDLQSASPSFTGLLSGVGTTQTGSSAVGVVDLSQTWNTTGNVTGIKLNVTNTASGASSLLMDLQETGVSKFKVSNIGVSTFRGNTTTDGGTLGSELTTTGSGTNWTGTSFATGYTHATGSIVALTSTLAAINNTYYQITYTVTGRTAGNFVLAFGGYTSGGITATGNIGPRAISTAVLTLTPTTDFDGTVVVSVKIISVGAATVSIMNSAGTVTNELRASSINSNTFIGLNAGSRNTTGTYNTANGYQALANNTTGTSNTANGFYALANNTTGYYNTANGFYALQNNTTGYNNTANGYQAGNKISGGVTNNTITNNSIFLGYNTKALADNQTNQIVIGHDETGLGSNTTILGNASTTDAAIRGSLMLGTTTPAASALLNMSSTTKGFLPPRMTTTQKNAIVSPAEGLVVYDLTLHKLCIYTGAAWEVITSL
jgi:hypothetical protein